jgi:hypothetical protein
MIPPTWIICLNEAASPFGFMVTRISEVDYNIAYQRILTNQRGYPRLTSAADSIPVWSSSCRRPKGAGHWQTKILCPDYPVHSLVLPVMAFRNYLEAA